MLTSLALKDFKSFGEQRVTIAPLTLLVGANASGKSNFLDALRFLQGVGLDMPLWEIFAGRWEAQREVWPGIRGGIFESARIGTSAFRLESSWKILHDLKGGIAGSRAVWSELDHAIECRTEGSPLVAHERLVRPGYGKYLFNTDAPALRGAVGLTDGHAISVAFRREAQGNSPTSQYPASRVLLGQVLERPAEHVHRSVRREAAALMAAMRDTAFLDISPQQMRNYRPRQVQSLGAHGENISPVLSTYCTNGDDKSDLIDWLSELCAPRIDDIRFDETRQQEVMLELVETGGIPVSARSLSDGTLRFLGELTALLTAAEGSTLLIEEIENGLHPTRASLLVELLEQVTAQRRIQVIATTHSPAILQGLSPEALANVIVFGRVPEESGTLMRRLGDLPAFDEVSQRRDIEHLFTTGWLERAL